MKKRYSPLMRGKRKWKRGGILAAGAGMLLGGKAARAASLPILPDQVAFVVVNPLTRQPDTHAYITISEPGSKHSPLIVSSARATVSLSHWQVSKHTPHMLIALLPGQSVRLPLPAPHGKPPTSDIYIVVRASLLLRNQTAPGVVTTRAQIKNSAGATVGGDVTQVIQNNAGVAKDSSGQEHVRGEHAEIAYVIDGVPLPDTLSGRQGSIVVLSTIEGLQFLTGSFPPEYGGQTAAVLNITTLPSARHPHTDLALQTGSYDTQNGELTLQGPIGKKAGYVLDVGASRTSNIEDPQQPDFQTAHNTGASINEFAKFRYRPTSQDTFTLTFSQAPSTMQLNNRAGMPASFAQSGQGYGLLGERDQNGAIPALNQVNPGGLGSAQLVLPSQQAENMNINQYEIDEFGVLEWQHRFAHQERLVLAATLLHSGQQLYNSNPAVNLFQLPIDNSIEYNPTVARNVHQAQVVGSLTMPVGAHQLKTGFLIDSESGNESYNIIPASQLALDALAAASPNLAPPGTVQTAVGSTTPVTDVYGNPVYTPTGTSPTLNVHRSGFYRAAYAQDTWKESHRFTINYGLRFDWFRSTQNLKQPVVNTSFLSPRFNFAYTPDHLTSIRWAYGRLFNYPPLAQGSVVGAPIKPETLDQYDLSVQREIAPGQSVELAYYVKNIRNQVDTGLLIPGSDIGLYSAVNFQHGHVHGVELSYDLTPVSGRGMNGFLNWSYSLAQPSGLDNAGQPAPAFNDHDQRNTVGLGMGYTWKNNANVNFVFSYGSGLASSQVIPSPFRTQNSQVNLHLATSPHFLWKHGSLSLDVLNLFDSRSVINFLSGFSGTRFQQGRRILFSISGSF